MLLRRGIVRYRGFCGNGRTHYYGAIRHPVTRERLWHCQHIHHRQEDALACADAALRLVYDGTPDVTVATLPDWQVEHGRRRPFPGAP